MRTTIELTGQSHRAITALASQRSERGLSAIVQTAVDTYLATLAAEEVQDVLSLEGSLSAGTADAMTEAMHSTRSNWR